MTQRRDQLTAIARVEAAITDLGYEERRGTPDPSGNKRRLLTEEWLLRHKILEKEAPQFSACALYSLPHGAEIVKGSIWNQGVTGEKDNPVP